MSTFSKTRKVGVVGAAILWTLAALGMSGEPARSHPCGLSENQPYGILSSEYVTPHVAWADPYSQGKIRALVLAPQWSQRETVELAQRLSLEYRPWMTHSFDRMVLPSTDDPASEFFGAPTELVKRLLDEQLRKETDVILVGKLNWTLIPAELRLAIFKKVAAGTGLVYVNPPSGKKELEFVFGGECSPEGVEWITRNLPLASLPCFAAIPPERLVKVVRFGQGRIVLLNYGESVPPAYQMAGWPCLTPVWDLTTGRKTIGDPLTSMPADKFPEAQLVPYEYYQALVARAVLWAAKKESPTQIETIRVPDPLAWPAKGQRVEVSLRALPQGATVKAMIRQRHEYDRTFSLGETKARETVAFALPDLPSEEYFLDVWVLDSARKILTWGSKAFHVSADFSFKEIRLARPSYDPGDPVEGTVTGSRNPTQNETVVAELWDNHSRQIERQNVKADGSLCPFRFGALHPLTILHRVRIRLMRDNREVVSTSLAFPVRARRRWDDFNEVAWSGGANYFITYWMLRTMAARDEVDAMEMGCMDFVHLRNVAEANLAVVPYTAAFGRFGVFPGHVAPEITTSGGPYGGNDAAFGCMSSPRTLAAVEQWGATESAYYGPYGPFAWSHGDEACYSAVDPDLCWSPTCLADFRQYVKSVYPDLPALNQEWGTTFKTWDEVMPLTCQEAMEKKKYAPWLLHRLSSDRVFTEFYRRTGEALARNDPGARAGFEGAMECALVPNGGGDWWRLSRACGILQSYCEEATQMEILRSFANRRQVTGMWYGTYGEIWQEGPNTVPYGRFFPWYCLFHQLNSSWFWTVGGPGACSGYAPDLTPLPFFRARTQSLREIKSGIGKLLLGGERLNDGIAIRYSDASRIADSLFAEPEVAGRCEGYRMALANFNKALEDGGLQYDYLADQQIEQGELIRRGIKTLIMPCSRAVSEEEAAAIRRFAEAGGLVIADLLPAVMNARGVMQPRSLLADLFPSERKGILTPVGKGQAVLVRNSLAGYSLAWMQNAKKFSGFPLKRRVPLPESGRQYLLTLLKEQAGIVPPIEIAPCESAPIPPTEVHRFRCGDIEFVGLLRQYFLYDNGTYRARLRFPRTGHLYDVLGARYLGSKNEIETEVSYEPKLYAMSPYKVKSIDLEVLPSAPPSTSSTVRIRLRAAGNARVSQHGFRLEVTAPDGQKLPHYSLNLLSKDGTATAEIPWALNDPPGKYTVSVTDVMSGVRRQLTVKYVPSENKESP